MGKVIIFPETTKKPITLIGHRAGFCYGADVSNDEVNYQRGINCIKSMHGRTLEFPEVHMGLMGYSAKVIREWYTHVGGSPTRLQASTRYIEYGDFKYITPHTVEKDPIALQVFKQTINTIRDSVKLLEKSCHIPREDASMLIPLCMETVEIDKRNTRNLIDMSRNRECSRAYWEYRELFFDVKEALASYSDECRTLVNMTFYPKCVELGYCPEEKCCGRYPKKEDLYTIGVDLANAAKD